MTMEHATHLRHATQADQLTNLQDVTCSAVRSGLWTDPATWADGCVPDVDGQVHIPANAAVIYDAGSDVVLKSIRVDGALRWSTTQSTELWVETIVTTPGSTFEIGSIGQPIGANFDAIIHFRDTAIDRKADPDQLSHGLIAFGEVNIQGALKDSHLRVATGARQGSRQITIEGELTNWRVGDTILLLGTSVSTVEEDRIVTEIIGDRVTFDLPLRFTHADGFVANLSRNVTLRSEDAEGVRGHVMLHHAVTNDHLTANSIRHTAFEDMGRTDFNAATGTANNPLGRYPLQLHEIGAGVDKVKTVVAHNVINRSPGWGIVHRNSHADVTHNTVYDTVGAGLVAETGFETGAWIGNVVVCVDGNSDMCSGFSHPVFVNDAASLTAQVLPAPQKPQIADPRSIEHLYGGGGDDVLEGETGLDALYDGVTQTRSDAQCDDIHGFAIDEGDTLDLSEVAQRFGLTATQTEAALCFANLERGVRVSLRVDDVRHDLVVIRDVDMRTLMHAAPWVFEDETPEPDVTPAPVEIMAPVLVLADRVEPMVLEAAVRSDPVPPQDVEAAFGGVGSDSFVFGTMSLEGTIDEGRDDPEPSAKRIDLGEASLEEPRMADAVKVSEVKQGSYHKALEEKATFRRHIDNRDYVRQEAMSS